ncbi:MAG TPA: hypothetical protein VIU62_06315 [Chloroflexota bacterium]|jgi:Flp pilus assembly pilin Flp
MWSKFIGWYLALAALWGSLHWTRTAWTWQGRRGQRGQGMVEYAVITALVVIAAMGIMQYFSQGVTTVFQHLVTRITSIG